MAYNSNIPQPGDALDQSQADLLANFQALKALIDINHETFGDPNEGKHKWISLPEQSAGPATAVNEMAVYVKAVSGVSQLFLRNENSGSEVDFTSATTSNSNGTLTLPSGIILKWGRATTAAGGSSTITFTDAFPTAILTAYATTAVVGGANTNAEANDRFVRVYNYTTTQLQAVAYIQKVTRDRAAQAYTWFAVGH